MRRTTGRLAIVAAVVSLAACRPEPAAGDGGPGGGLDGGAIDDDGGAGPIDDCTLRCLDALARCAGPGGSDTVDCARLCATYAALGTGCETERDALYECAFGPPCGRCGLVDGPESDALVACIVARSPRPCFVSCRAAIAADCAPAAHDPEDCNCIAQYYESRGAFMCQGELDAYYVCTADHPCDRISECVAEGTALSTCGLGCARGQVGCYVGRDGRCIDEAALQTDPDNCGGCNRDCGEGTCTGGACACAAGSHACPDGSCSADDDVSSCGAACAPCPAAPANGAAACSSGRCGFVCDPGYRAEGAACVRTCGVGEHLCGDLCFPDDDTTHCGAGCTACPAPPANAHATCAVGACSTTCDAGFVPVGGACLGCDPFTGTGCAPSQWCYPAGGSGLSCATAGSLREGAACVAANDCERGVMCASRGGSAATCLRLCDADVAGSCASGATCMAFVGVTPPNLGVCAP